ncbi:MAG: HAMP domain-containing histidine kinase, partial [Myxococcales bacterium]|nr:HAMP domain-containing histidine kinase [Myxococcales bacterium]
AAHELRTPLAAMRAHIDTTLRRPRGTDELEEALGAVGGEVDRLSRLASRLLDLAQLEQAAPPLDAADLRGVVDAAVAAARAMAEARGQALLVRGPEVAPLSGDEAALRQAVDNLLVNAIRHGPEGSVVELQLMAADRGWRLTVVDEGPGVAPAAAAALFEPFARGDRRGEGAGLGLAIVRAVAHRHGGEVAVVPGDGGRFQLDLPGAPAA